MTPAELLLEELEHIAGLSLSEVLDRLDDCMRAAKTPLARQRLLRLEDTYLDLYRNDPEWPEGA